MDRWCAKEGIGHRLIPVGVKELNGKVENTHKQDDREFFAMNDFSTYESIALGTEGYNERWNTQRATKALGWLTPAGVLEQAGVRGCRGVRAFGLAMMVTGSSVGLSYLSLARAVPSKVTQK